MNTFSTLNSNDYTVTSYPVYAPITWSLASSSAGVEITYPLGLEGAVTINEAIKDSEEINIDTKTQKGVLHKSIQHIFYNYYGAFFVSQSRIVTSSSIMGKDNLYVISIAQNVYGDFIKPGTFEFQINSITPKIIDDALGNLIISSSGTIYQVGNIFYKNGIAVITIDSGSTVASVSALGAKIVNTSTINMIYNSNISTERHQINVKLAPNEFIFSPFNPSVTKTLKVTSSITQSFDQKNIPKISQNTWKVSELMGSEIIKPYITTIGLYNDRYELLAIAKLSQPIQRTFATDQIFIVRFDVE